MSKQQAKPHPNLERACSACGVTVLCCGGCPGMLGKAPKAPTVDATNCVGDAFGYMEIVRRGEETDGEWFEKATDPSSSIKHQGSSSIKRVTALREVGRSPRSIFCCIELFKLFKLFNGCVLSISHPNPSAGLQVEGSTNIPQNSIQATTAMIHPPKPLSRAQPLAHFAFFFTVPSTF